MTDPLSHVSAPQVAEMTGRPLRTVQRDCAAGVIAGAVKAGRDWLIPIASARAYAAREPYDSLRTRPAHEPQDGGSLG